MSLHQLDVGARQCRVCGADMDAATRHQHEVSCCDPTHDDYQDYIEGYQCVAAGPTDREKL